jgi:pseudouridine synthase
MARPSDRPRNNQQPDDAADESSSRVRLQRVLADAGIAARRVCEQMIEQGRVVVNGHRITQLPVFVNPREDRILVDGKPIPPPEEHVYIVLHKPERTLVVTTDEPGMTRRTVMDLVDHPARARLFPVGRLDYDTTGLLLITNDGSLAQFVGHPRNGVTKTYHAVVKGQVTQETLGKIRRQSKLIAKAEQAEKRKAARQAMGEWSARAMPAPKKKTPVTPIEARVLKVEDGKTTLEIDVVDGRALLREALLAAGLDVRKLTRVQIGPIDLKGLPVGSWRELMPRERKALLTPGFVKREPKPRTNRTPNSRRDRAAARNPQTAETKASLVAQPKPRYDLVSAAKAGLREITGRETPESPKSKAHRAQRTESAAHNQRTSQPTRDASRRGTQDADQSPRTSAPMTSAPPKRDADASKADSTTHSRKPRTLLPE